MSKKNKAKANQAKKPTPKAAKPAKKVHNKTAKPSKPAKKPAPKARKAAPAPKKVPARKPARTAAKPAAKPIKAVVVKAAKPATKPEHGARPAVAVKPAPASKAGPATPKSAIPSPQPAALPVPAAPAAASPAPAAPVKVPAKAPSPGRPSSKTSASAEVFVKPEVPPVRREPPGTPGSTVKKGSAIFYDSHMHTPLCKHAWGEPEEYAEQGLRAGLKGIIFTCHCPMPNGFWPTVRMDEAEFDAYVAMVGRATEKYKGRLDVWLGLESEYYPGYEKYIEHLHQRADFHFILGSVHWQAKEYLSKYEGGTIEGFRRTYFNHLADSAESGLYDCLGHPDLVKNYHPDSWCFPILKDHVARCLDRIAATGIAMELNTSGLNKSYAEMNPGNEMLGMMAERKIPIVVGSDAHRAPRVGDHFIRALENLKAAGYKDVSYFEWRQRKVLKLDDVLSSLRKHEAAKAG